ncbi:WD40-repeat-containing domain protein [Talaromyces proteolyticus]|uniref:WD40-repeat-containing domain protein n=1 Tax=Talaromyces proteolyticus TaxID=1131652 RepID=A0AAD4KUG7_9EURO|nr:WD40-repeat-containing domain protein [Talaromyces proteolyticus]KAH8696284.1 WD40-repeat-containing domain protein [Talaromyces proteolyticus]
MPSSQIQTSTEPSVQLTPKCLAVFQSSHIPLSSEKQGTYHDTVESNYFKSAEWTADGTTVITDSADNHLRTFILPPDLLEEREQLLQLEPYSTIPSNEPVYATAIYPFYSLQDPSTTLILSSVRDHPIRLSSALAPRTLGTYSLVNPTTEAFITPHSILYPSELGGSQFITGSDSLICIFDVSRTGSDGPVTRFPTIPSKRKQIVGGGVGMKGIVSALAMNPAGDGILAAGTFTRYIALYGSRGSGELIGTFSIVKTEADKHIGGTGITQLLWSPCGRYLYVAERKSGGMLVYDIRVTGQLLGWLEGREALSNQRMKADVVATGDGESHEIWAGGTDGTVRVWSNPYSSIGSQKPSHEFDMHCDPATSSVLHPGSSVLATCSGQKHFPDFDVDEVKGDGYALPTEYDNSLKIWSLEENTLAKSLEADRYD